MAEWILALPLPEVPHWIDFLLVFGPVLVWATWRCVVERRRG